MIVAVCVDDRDGMEFNGRRLSRDRAQQEDLLALCDGRLWIAPVSVKLFDWAADRVQSDPDFLEHAGSGAFCFVEDRPLAPAADRIEEVILYRWNRAYPADRWFDLELSAFELREQTEFPGRSHERITRERYIRRA